MKRFFCDGYEIKREADAIQYSVLMGSPLTMEFRHPDSDPILGHGVHEYDHEIGAWRHVGPIPGKRPVAVDRLNTEEPPVCAKNCQWRKLWEGDRLQHNGLRIESGWLVEKARCAWNLKPGHLGGRALDYAPCIMEEHPND